MLRRRTAVLKGQHDRKIDRMAKFRAGSSLHTKYPATARSRSGRVMAGCRPS